MNKRKIILLYIHLSYYSKYKLPGSQGKGKKDKVMKKNFKKITKDIKKNVKEASNNPKIYVPVGTATGTLIGLGIASIAEKAVGKISCKIREKKTEKKA